MDTTQLKRIADALEEILRLDPKYWIKRKKNKKKASSIKQQASSLTVL